MGESIELIKVKLSTLFPGLVNDAHFKITSDEDVKYNCIAWAYGMFKDRWMQFDTKPRYDGVWYWWPEGVTVSNSISSYIEAFKTKGFEVCETFELERGFIKICLYVADDGTDKCSHAARQKTNGLWMSKLGQLHDIQHGTPYSIEGKAYGKVHTFMKLKF